MRSFRALAVTGLLVVALLNLTVARIGDAAAFSSQSSATQNGGVRSQAVSAAAAAIAFWAACLAFNITRAWLTMLADPFKDPFIESEPSDEFVGRVVVAAGTCVPGSLLVKLGASVTTIDVIKEGTKNLAEDLFLELFNLDAFFTAVGGAVKDLISKLISPIRSLGQ